MPDQVYDPLKWQQYLEETWKGGPEPELTNSERVVLSMVLASMLVPSPWIEIIRLMRLGYIDYDFTANVLFLTDKGKAF